MTASSSRLERQRANRASDQSVEKRNTLIVSDKPGEEHVKPTQPGEPSPPTDRGTILTRNGPSDPNTGVEYNSIEIFDDGRKCRGERTSEFANDVPKPDHFLERKTARGTGVGRYRGDAVREVTYVGPR